MKLGSCNSDRATAGLKYPNAGHRPGPWTAARTSHDFFSLCSTMTTTEAGQENIGVKRKSSRRETGVGLGWSHLEMKVNLDQKSEPVEKPDLLRRSDLAARFSSLQHKRREAAAKQQSLVERWSALSSKEDCLVTQILDLAERKKRRASDQRHLEHEMTRFRRAIEDTENSSLSMTSKRIRLTEEHLRKSCKGSCEFSERTSEGLRQAEVKLERDLRWCTERLRSIE